MVPGPAGNLFTAQTEILPGITACSLHQLRPVECAIILLDLASIEGKLDDRAGRDSMLALLTPAEAEQFDAFTYPKRRKEWLAGRLACKLAVCTLLAVDDITEQFSRLSILPDASGVPVLTFQDRTVRLPAVSISHSGCYGVAMAAFTGTCGLDIQEVTDRINNVVSRFAGPDELALLEEGAPALTTTERLTLLWAAKEAMKKSHLHDQPVIFQGMILKEISAGDGFTIRLSSTSDNLSKAEVSAYLLDRYALAFTTSGTPNA